LPGIWHILVFRGVSLLGRLLRSIDERFLFFKHHTVYSMVKNWGMVWWHGVYLG
jgi:hypothetical protein